MKGDFTRSTFRPQNGYTSVRMQQGRLQVDADWNEQADIMAYLYQSQALDMLGVAAAPRTAEQGPQVDVFENFRLKPVEAGDELNFAPGSGQLIAPGEDLKIAPGHIYIDGVLCELSETVTYLNQPYYADGKAVDLKDGNYLYLAYLDVWQQHITALDDPQIREIALASVPDTTTRLKTIWQVKLLALEEKSEGISLSLNAAKEKLKQPQKGQLQLRIEPSRQQNNLANEQSIGNALYRVEIHDSGAQGTATFKWSNNNGIVVSQILQVLGGNTLVIDQQARDDAYKFSANDWVEIIDTAHELRGEPGLLVKLTDKTTDGKLVFDPATTISVESNHPVTLGDFKGASNQNIFKVRRWEDIISGPTRNIIQTTGSRWIDLDDSALQVRFPEPENPNTAYATGDYWLIPMRFGIPYLEGLNINTDPKTVLTISPEGIDHSYAPLALVKYDGTHFSLKKTQEELDHNDSKDARGDFRVTFPALTRCLDSFGGVIQGSLEVQENLLVTQRRDKDNNPLYGRLGVGTYTPKARVHVEIDDPNLKGQIIQAADGQTKNLQEWHRYSDPKVPLADPLAVVTPKGYLGLGLKNPDAPLSVSGQVKLFETGTTSVNNQLFNSAISLQTVDAAQQPTLKQLTFNLNNVDKGDNQVGQFTFNGSDLLVNQGDLLVSQTTRATKAVVGTLNAVTPTASVYVETSNNDIGQIIKAAKAQKGNLQEWHGYPDPEAPSAEPVASEPTALLAEPVAVVTPKGYLGLGITDPKTPLAVAGEVQLFSSATEQSFYGSLAAQKSSDQTSQLTFQLSNNKGNAEYVFKGGQVKIEKSAEIRQNLLIHDSNQDSNSVKLGVGTLKPEASVHVEITKAERVGQIIKAVKGQTGDLQQWYRFKDENQAITVIDSEGNLGLGLNAPDSRLAVRGQVKLFETGTTALNNESFHSALTLQTTDTDQRLTFSLNNVDTGNSKQGQFIFNGGDLLVSQTVQATQAIFGPLTTSMPTPEANIHVAISNNDIGQIIQAATGQTKDLQQWHGFKDGKQTITVIDSEGNLGLGLSAPDSRLAIRGQVRLFETDAATINAQSFNSVIALQTEDNIQQLTFSLKNIDTANNKKGQFIFTGGDLAIQSSVKLFDKDANDTDQDFYAELTTDKTTQQLTFQLKKDDDSNSAIQPGFTFTGGPVTVATSVAEGAVQMDVQGLLKAQSLQLDDITITKFSNQFSVESPPEQSSHDSSQAIPTEQAVKQYVTDSISDLSETLKNDLNNSLTGSLTKSLGNSLTDTFTTQIQTAVGSKADANGSLSNDFKANRLEIGNSLDTASGVSAQRLSGHARLHVWGTNLSESIPGTILANRSQITSDVLQKGDSIQVDNDIKLVTGVTEKTENPSSERTVTVSPPFAPDPDDVREQADFNYQRQSPIARFANSSGEDQVTLTAQGNLLVGPLNESSQPPVDAKLYVAGKVYGQQVESEEIVGTSIVQLSSQTLKENISALSEDEANVLLGQLDPVKFSYRQDETHQTHVGFIAETVPDVVASANHRGISPLDITAILTKVVQDHHQELNMMKTIIEQQQQTIQALTAKVDQLERRRFRL